jgi:hypothetical protein
VLLMEGRASLEPGAASAVLGRLRSEAGSPRVSAVGVELPLDFDDYYEAVAKRLPQQTVGAAAGRLAAVAAKLSAEDAARIDDGGRCYHSARSFAAIHSVSIYKKSGIRWNDSTALV